MDLVDVNEEVAEEVAREYANEIGADFYLISARNGTGIDRLFNELGKKFLSSNKDSNKNKRKSSKLEKGKKKKKKNCC